MGLECFICLCLWKHVLKKQFFSSLYSLLLYGLSSQALSCLKEPHIFFPPGAAFGMERGACLLWLGMGAGSAALLLSCQTLLCEAPCPQSDLSWAWSLLLLAGLSGPCAFFLLLWDEVGV